MADQRQPIDRVLPKGADTGSGRGVKREKGGKAAASPQEVAIKYGMSWSVIQSDPALARWFSDFAKRFVAANGKIDESRFRLELEQQDWWRTHSATYIADLKQELENPEDYKQSIAGDLASLRDMANEMGAQADDAALMAVAKNARRLGWNASQQRNALANLVTATSGDYEGQAGSNQDDLAQWAESNGISMSTSMVDSYVRQLATGSTNIDEIKSDIRRTYMAGAFPAWADKINAGMDIADIAAPYKATMAQLLETDDATLSLNDPIMMQGLQSVGPDGKPRVMPLYEFQQKVRSDPRWQTTDNAYATYTNVASGILRTFGLA
jgi:hypothetical protein